MEYKILISVKIENINALYPLTRTIQQQINLILFLSSPIIYLLILFMY